MRDFAIILTVAAFLAHGVIRAQGAVTSAPSTAAKEKPFIDLGYSADRSVEEQDYHSLLYRHVPEIGKCNIYFRSRRDGALTPVQREKWSRHEGASFAHLTTWFGYEPAIWALRMTTRAWDFVPVLADRAGLSEQLTSELDKECSGMLSELSDARKKWLKRRR
jgi:hypothetical protein